MMILKRRWLPIAFLCLTAPAIAGADGNVSAFQVSQEKIDPKLGFLVAKNAIVTFHGTVSFDNAGASSAQILYPAPNVGGMVAAVLTHGLLVESSKRSQKEKLQQDADGILLPYQSILAEFALADLFQRSLPKMETPGSKVLLEADQPSETNLRIETKPSFLLTQDQSSIILSNEIMVFGANAPSTPLYKGSIKVVSKAKEEKDIEAFWKENKGEQFKEQSAGLFANSLDIAMREISNNDSSLSAPYKTIRYREGMSEKFERGQLIADNCQQIVIKTLRGTILSVPGNCVKKTE